MAADRFLDTKVIVYAVDTMAKGAAKREIARKLIRDGGFSLSTQVLQEFFVTATRKLRRPLSVATAARWIDQLARVDIVIVDVTLVRTAVAYSSRFKLSYWDGAILVAAEASGAKVVYSEDLSHGQVYGALRVVNPFKS